MTKEQMREIIDQENGAGFSSNINLNGYVFKKNGSFIIFQFREIEGVKVCHIKYVHYKNKKDLTTIMVYCCNFWMGNNIQFIFYKEKGGKDKGTVEYLKSLNFREEILSEYNWKWRFRCGYCKNESCTCLVHSMYK